MELLARRLETLVNADVSREEVLRQLKEIKPNLRKGRVLFMAEALIDVSRDNRDLQERRDAQEYLSGIIPLTNSYITSAGPLGTTREEVTVWDNPDKPMRFVGLTVSISLALFGAIAYKLGAPVLFWWLPLFLSLPAGFIVGLERTVVRNKYRARKDLDENILQSAKSFESMLEKINFERSH